jgi:hypothetical protein
MFSDRQFVGNASGVVWAMSCQIISALDFLKCLDRLSSFSRVVSSSRSMKRLPYARESWERPPGIPPLEASPARQLAGKSTAVISRSMWRNQGAVYPHFAVCLKSDVMPSFPEAAFRQRHIYKSSISRDA